MIAGASLGLAAGISPGPLLTLVVTATLERGFGAGARVALGPLLADLPILILAFAFTASLPPVGVRALTLAGGFFILYLGVDTVRRSGAPAQDDGETAAPAPRDTLRGALVNLTNPSPWLFWLGIGGPQVVSLWRRGGGGAIGFLGTFYLGLVGSKIAIAALVARGRGSLEGPGYRRAVVFCGLLLCALGFWLIGQGGAGLMGWSVSG
ncbi:MAG: LysE family transporter [Acidobacteriota bacterium]